MNGEFTLTVWFTYKMLNNASQLQVSYYITTFHLGSFLNTGTVHSLLRSRQLSERATLGITDIMNVS